MLRFCLRSLGPWRWQIWLGLALFAGQLLSMLALIPLAQSFEKLFESFELQAFWQLLTSIGALYLLKHSLEYFSQLQLSSVAVAWSSQLRAQAFSRILQADWQQLKDLAPEDLLTRLSDDLDKLRTAVQAALQRLIPSTIILLALLGVLLLLSWSLSLVIFAAMPLAAWALQQLSQRLRQQSHGLQNQLSKLYLELNEALQHLPLIRLYRLESYQQKRLEASQQIWLRAQQRTLGWQLLERPLLSSLQIILIVVLLGLSAWFVDQGVLSLGQLLAYASALALAIDPGLWLGEAWGQLQAAQASWERLKLLLELPPSSQAGPQTSNKNCFEAQQLTLSYGQRGIFRQLDFELAPGSKIGLRGPSGTGKSSLLRILAGLESAQSGRVCWPASWLQQPHAVLLIPQRAALFNRSLRENLSLDQDFADSELIAMLELCGFSQKLAELPQGLDTPLGPRGSWLSGGEIQRLALARALLRKPCCLLLDESTSELDAELESLILQGLRLAFPEMIWLVVSHRPATLQQLDGLWQLENMHLQTQPQSVGSPQL